MVPVTMVHGLGYVFVFTNLFLFIASRGSWACEVFAQTQSGPVCGTVIQHKLAVFRNVPYAEQPIGKLRFKELHAPKPWVKPLQATEPGPICPQVDVLFGGLMDTSNMNEACIYANIHTPISALPSCEDGVVKPKAGIPVLVFIHGGGWQSGSGNPDFYGPEYFVDKDVVVITFNYRLNVFGFLSLNTTDVPGNAGLRDVLHLLRWVRDNVHSFGGDPDNVTLMGQSCGASNAHFIAQSPLSKGLFKRLIFASGTALPAFFTTDPVYAKEVSDMMLKQLGIPTSDPDAAFKQLVDIPMDAILKAYSVVQEATGLITFAPVKETQLGHVTPIVASDPALNVHAFNDIPLLIGFTSNECPFVEHRIEQLHLIDALKENPTLLLSPKLVYSSSNETANKIADKIKKYYFKGDITYDEFMNVCLDSFYVYPALKLAQIRAESGAANTFVYQFSYEGEFRPTVVGRNLSDFDGVCHTEDLNYVFRTNYVLDKRPLVSRPVDDRMTTSWIDTIINFMKCSRPNCKDNKSWPSVDANKLAYQDLKGPGNFHLTELPENRKQMIKFFDDLRVLF